MVTLNSLGLLEPHGLLALAALGGFITSYHSSVCLLGSRKMGKCDIVLSLPGHPQTVSHNSEPASHPPAGQGLQRRVRNSLTMQLGFTLLHNWLLLEQTSG